jgi:hypothetical protein
MAKNKHQPKVPGEVDPANKGSSGEPGDPGELVSVPKSTLESMQAAIDALTAKVNAQGRPVRKTSDDDLPDASTVDRTKITAPVLTKTGWLVPDKYGSNAAQPKG